MKTNIEDKVIALERRISALEAQIAEAKASKVDSDNVDGEEGSA